MFFEYLIVGFINLAVFLGILLFAGLLMIIANISKLFTREGKEK